MCPCLAAESVTSLPSQNNGTTSPDPFESQPLTVASSKPSSARKTPESFLGPNAALVNLDSLVTRPAPPAQSLNPFLAPGRLSSQASSGCLLCLRMGVQQASRGLFPLCDREGVGLAGNSRLAHMPLPGPPGVGCGSRCQLCGPFLSVETAKQKLSLTWCPPVVRPSGSVSSKAGGVGWAARGEEEPGFDV